MPEFRSTLKEIEGALEARDPEARKAFEDCSNLVDQYLNSAGMAQVKRKILGDSGDESETGGSQLDVGFALGMWMWEGVYGRKPSSREGSDMYLIGRFVHASFGNYWNEGVRYVVITG